MWDNLRLGYTESLGHPLLRTEIAQLYQTVAPDEVITFAGAEEGIFLAMHASLAAGDHIVVLWPAYQSLYEVARSIGARVSLVPLDPSSWEFDPEALLAAVRPNTKLVVVNFPHSPTGALASQDALIYLTTRLEQRGIILFSDEVYRGLELDEDRRLPAAVDLAGKTLSLGVLSKTYALAGLRIGWIATHDPKLREELARLKDYTTICGSAPSELLGVIALRAKEYVVARSRGIIAGNMPLLDAFFARQSERFSWVPPRAGSVAFPRLRTEAAGAIEQFCDELVEKTGVLLLPGSRFEHTGNHFRIGFGRADMQAALERLEEFANDR